MKETQNIEFKRLQFPTFEQVRGGMLATIPRERFVAINNGTSQKSGQETEGGTKTTQKTTQEIESGTETTEKSSQKSSVIILSMMKEHPYISTQEIADRLKISRRAVTKQITKLKAQGIIRRIGPDKGGHWEIIEKP